LIVKEGGSPFIFRNYCAEIVMKTEFQFDSGMKVLGDEYTSDLEPLNG